MQATLLNRSRQGLMPSAALIHGIVYTGSYYFRLYLDASVKYLQKSVDGASWTNVTDISGGNSADGYAGHLVYDSTAEELAFVIFGASQDVIKILDKDGGAVGSLTCEAGFDTRSIDVGHINIGLTRTTTFYISGDVSTANNYVMYYINDVPALVGCTISNGNITTCHDFAEMLVSSGVYSQYFATDHGLFTKTYSDDPTNDAKYTRRTVDGCRYIAWVGGTNFDGYLVCEALETANGDFATANRLHNQVGAKAPWTWTECGGNSVMAASYSGYAYKGFRFVLDGNIVFYIYAESADLFHVKVSFNHGKSFFDFTHRHDAIDLSGTNFSHVAFPSLILQDDYIFLNDLELKSEICHPSTQFTLGAMLSTPRGKLIIPAEERGLLTQGMPILIYSGDTLVAAALINNYIFALKTGYIQAGLITSGVELMRSFPETTYNNKDLSDVIEALVDETGSVTIINYSDAGLATLYTITLNGGQSRYAKIIEFTKSDQINGLPRIFWVDLNADAHSEGMAWIEDGSEHASGADVADSANWGNGVANDGSKYVIAYYLESIDAPCILFHDGDASNAMQKIFTPPTNLGFYLETDEIHIMFFTGTAAKNDSYYCFLVKAGGNDAIHLRVCHDGDKNWMEIMVTSTWSVLEDSSGNLLTIEPETFYHVKYIIDCIADTYTITINNVVYTGKKVILDRFEEYAEDYKITDDGDWEANGGDDYHTGEGLTYHVVTKDGSKQLYIHDAWIAGNVNIKHVFVENVVNGDSISFDFLSDKAGDDGNDRIVITPRDSDGKYGAYLNFYIGGANAGKILYYDNQVAHGFLDTGLTFTTGTQCELEIELTSSTTFKIRKDGGAWTAALKTFEALTGTYNNIQFETITAGDDIEIYIDNLYQNLAASSSDLLNAINEGAAPLPILDVSSSSIGISDFIIRAIYICPSSITRIAYQYSPMVVANIDVEDIVEVTTKRVLSNIANSMRVIGLGLADDSKSNSGQNTDSFGGMDLQGWSADLEMATDSLQTQQLANLRLPYPKEEKTVIIDMGDYGFGSWSDLLPNRVVCINAEEFGIAGLFNIISVSYNANETVTLVLGDMRLAILEISNSIQQASRSMTGYYGVNG